MAHWYFAWVDADTEFDPDIHNVEDEDVFSFTIDQSEGDFGTLSIIIKNPRIGLLNAGRKLWAFVSQNKLGVAHPLFKGRLVGVPDNIYDTLVTLKFIARPVDFVAQKLALAETLKVLPYWDPIFITESSWEDPDTVLESRSAHWHIDRVTHEVTVSDIIVGEDGTLEFTETDSFYDNVAISLNEVPLRTVSIKATIPWTQAAEGDMSMTSFVLNHWPNREGAPSGYISSYTFDGLKSSWPKDGTTLSGGWSVKTGNLVDCSKLVPQTLSLYASLPICTLHGTNWKLPASAQAIGYFYVEPPVLEHEIPAGSVTWPPWTTGDMWSGVDGAGADLDIAQLFVPIGYGRPTFELKYECSREMAEVVSFTMSTATQEIVTAADDADVLAIELTANKVSDTTRGGSIPIGDVRMRTYAHTVRGVLSIQHLIMVARANLVSRSRAVKVSFETTADYALDITLRKNALVHDHRFPGGQAVGKITGYTIEADGEGTCVVKVTIGCAIGYGGALEESPGEPTYISDDYIDTSYYQRDGAITLIDTQDLTYSMPQQSFFDDGVDLMGGMNPDKMVRQWVVENGPNAQNSYLTGACLGCDDNIKFSSHYFWTYEAHSRMGAFGLSYGKYQTPKIDQSRDTKAWDGVDRQQIPTADYVKGLEAIPTTVRLTMRSLNTGPFTGSVNVVVSDLIIPKQIDLEAPSVT
jgi:hypothetical protein